jgi:hypothetical protein
MDESIRLFGARILTGLLLIAITTLVILAYQEYSAELAKEAELFVASSLQQFDTALAVK